MKKNRLKKQGFTLIEAMMGMTITGIVLVGVISSQMGNYKAVEKNKDAIFAQNKATQMIEELRSVVRKGRSDVNSLDIYDNNNVASPILTTDDIEGSTTDAKAANQISGNRIQNGKWRFVRNVKISKNSDLAKSRTVTVSVYYADANGNPVQPPLATLSTILSTAHTSNIPTQVIDTYALAINNQPGWWSSLSSLKQTIQDSAYDLKVKNPGLDYRFHFITRSSFGRDPYYSPYCNKIATTDNDPNIAYPYTYNGKILDTAHADRVSYFYNPVEMISDGMRLNTDDDVNGNTFYNAWYGTKNTPSGNPLGTNDKIALTNVYSAADQYNHAVRGPEDVAINEKLKNYYAKQDPVVDYEPSYRKFIDDMYESDTSNPNPIHRNLMITNLHGELFPTIPLRNYSDAAKTPDGKEIFHDLSSTGIIVKKDTVNTTKDLVVSSKYKRVVTHPEQLEYSTDAAKDRKIYLRVYPYLTDPTQTTPNLDKIDTVSLFIPTTKNVGASTTGTEKQTLDNLPDFTIPNETAFIDQIKKNIKFQYIDNDFVKRSNNYSGYVKIDNPISGTTNKAFYPIGSIINISGYNFKIVAKRDKTSSNPDVYSDVYGNTSDMFITADPTPPANGNGNATGNNKPATDDIYKIVSCDLNKKVSLDNITFSTLTNVSVANVTTPNLSGAWTVDVSPVSPSAYTTLGLTSSTADIHSIYEGSYEIIVNPAFDRMGTGTKTINPGILIKLHGTGTKNTARYTTLNPPFID